MKYNVLSRRFLHLFLLFVYIYQKKKYPVFSAFMTHSIFFLITKRTKRPVNSSKINIKTNTQTKKKKKKTLHTQ